MQTLYGMMTDPVYCFACSWESGIYAKISRMIVASSRLAAVDPLCHWRGLREVTGGRL